MNSKSPKEEIFNILKKKIKYMNTFIKICGIKKYDHIKVAEKHGALWYGLVFYKKSPRYIDLNKAEKIVEKSTKSIFPVAVTVNPEEKLIGNLTEIGIRNIQLHGNETVEFCEYFKKKFNIKIFKGIGLETKKDIDLAKKYKEIVDWIIFDRKDLLVYGGTGKSFNWNILSKIDTNINYIISGGLTHKNVLNALVKTKAKGVDVSSGVEKKIGHKSEDLIEKFCKSVKLYKEIKLLKKFSYKNFPDKYGKFGDYGGRFVAETLMPLILDLEKKYNRFKNDPKFIKEFNNLSKNFIGRPSPLYFAENLN